MHRLPWLLGSGHHALLTDDHEIIDLAEYLSNYAHIQTQKGPEVLKYKVDNVAQQITETAHSLSNGHPVVWLFPRIDATGNRLSILQKVDRMVVQRQEQLKQSPLFYSEIEAKQMAEVKRGRPEAWSAWARRLLVWDMRHRPAPATFPQIGEQLFCDAPLPERAALQAYTEAKVMIKAADSGPWPPKFTKSSR